MLVSTVQFCPSAPSFHYLRDSELVLRRMVAPLVAPGRSFSAFWHRFLRAISARSTPARSIVSSHRCLKEFTSFHRPENRPPILGRSHRNAARARSLIGMAFATSRCSNHWHSASLNQRAVGLIAPNSNMFLLQPRQWPTGYHL